MRAFSLHHRRLLLLLTLAVLAALPETLVRADNQQVAFQTWLVIQLLGVIIAAIAVAAMFSVLGLGLVRLLTRPIMHHASTFVAWSFLRAPRVTLPWPARVWHLLTEAVDADRLAPAQQPRWQLLVILPLLGAGAAGIWQWLSPVGLPDFAAIGLRNLGGALLIHGLLMLMAQLPWRRARALPLVLAAAAGLIAVAIFGRHPLILPYFDATTAVCALVTCAALAVWRGGSGALLPLRLQKLGLWLLPLGIAVATLPVSLLGTHVNQTVLIAVFSAGAIVTLLGLYLLLQGQAKVSLPVFVSIVGVAAGTWALIVVLSVMGGFATDLRSKMLVANAHALIERAGRAKPLTEVAQLANRLRSVAGVAAVSPQVRGDAILSSAFNVNNFVAIRGIDAQLPEVQRELGGTLVTGSLHLLQNPAALGSDRALGRKPAYEDDGDMFKAPSLAIPSTDTQNDPELKALLNLPPGPRDPAPPQLGSPPAHEPRGRDLPRMIVVPSGEKPRLLDAGNPQELPTIAPPPVVTETEDVPLEQLIAVPPEPARPSEPDGALQRLIADDPGGGVGEVADLPVSPGILLGAELARSLQADLGDRVEVVTPDGDIGPTGLRPRVRTFRVAGTFETGLYEADSKVAYITLTEAARYFNLGGDANVLELRLLQPETPDAVLVAIRQVLTKLQVPPDVEVVDWRQLNRSLFSALAFERLVIFLVLGLIILVAAFSIVSALTMVILQKYDGIAMLRAMGATAGTIRWSFVQMGGVIGLIGTTAGAILGLGTCFLILKLGIQLPEAYYVRTLPVSIQLPEIGIVIVASIAVSLVATIFPATSAARCEPLEGLRHG